MSSAQVTAGEATDLQAELPLAKGRGRVPLLGAHQGHVHQHGGEPHESPPDPGDDCPDTPPVVDTTACGWSPFSDGLAGANVRHVLFDQRTSSTVYAATGSTVWQSVDGGLSWHSQGALPSAAFNQLMTDGDDPSVLLAASTNGLVRSLDAGKTWALVSLGGLVLSTASATVEAPLRVYAAFNGAGVLRSDDGGSAFGDVGFGFPYGSTIGLSVSEADPRDVVAAVWDIDASGGLGNTGSLLRSRDGGATWSTTLSVASDVDALARCQTNGDVLLAATGQGVARSSNGGDSWEILPVDGPTRRVVGVTISPEDCDTFYALQEAVGPRRTRDGGRSYGSALVDGLNLLKEGSFPGKLSIDPHDSTRLILATHGGLYVSTNAGGSWSIADGVRDFAVTALSSSPLSPSRLWLGSWGSGVWTRASAAEPWLRIPIADLGVDHVMGLQADPYDDSRVLVGSTNAWVNDPDNAFHFERRTTPVNATTFAFDAQDPAVIYLGSQVYGILKSSDAGETFATSNGALAPWPTSAGTFIDVRQIQVDPHDSATLYAATNGRGVYKSSDAASSWTRVLARDESVRCLLLALDAPGTLYACVDGIQRSVDGGNTWQDDSAGLPTLDIGGLVHDDVTGYLYATSARGVFVQKPGGAWEGLENTCLPSAGTPAVAVDDGHRYLVVSGGSGIYRHAL